MCFVGLATPNPIFIIWSCTLKIEGELVLMDPRPVYIFMRGPEQTKTNSWCILIAEVSVGQVRYPIHYNHAIAEVPLVWGQQKITNRKKVSIIWGYCLPSRNKTQYSIIGQRFLWYTAMVPNMPGIDKIRYNTKISFFTSEEAEMWWLNFGTWMKNKISIMATLLLWPAFQQVA